MWARIFVFSFLFSSLSAKIVSLDLCADQWVLGLVEKKEIYAVSCLAKEADLSYLAQKAENIKTHAGSPEEFLDPSIRTIIGYEPISPLLKKVLKKRKVTLILLKHPDSFQKLKTQTMLLTKIFKKESLGEKWIHRLSKKHPLPKKNAAFYGTQGLCPGGETLFSDILKTAGYQNIYRHKKGWTYNSLESLLLVPLSILFLSAPPDAHPLWDYLKKKTVLKVLPRRLTLCSYPPAIFDLIQVLGDSHHA